jgi:hypothetical protein
MSYRRAITHSKPALGGLKRGLNDFVVWRVQVSIPWSVNRRALLPSIEHSYPVPLTARSLARKAACALLLGRRNGTGGGAIGGWRHSEHPVSGSVVRTRSSGACSIGVVLCGVCSIRVRGLHFQQFLRPVVLRRSVARCEQAAQAHDGCDKRPSGHDHLLIQVSIAGASCGSSVAPAN